jgi:hypothetical protein
MGRESRQTHAVVSVVIKGRLARRVKAWAAANVVPVIYCKAGEPGSP